MSYIWPQELPLEIIIFIMWCTAGFVIYRCIGLYRKAKENLDTLERIEDVSFLESSLKQNNINTKESFKKYETEKGKNDNNEVLFEHLHAIYDAGYKSSDLESELLISNSISKIFTNIDIVKTLISLFLVFGILGTLAGLAISIGGFHGANFVVTGQSSSSTAQELSALFGNLRGAFAPSMWGVAFTILFTFIYTYLIQEKCINKLTEKLTLTTINSWLPVLYPTDFQRGDNSIVKLNATIQNAEGINHGVTELQSNLSTSNKTLKMLAKVSDQINAATIKFENSTNKIMEIKELYDQLRACNDQFNQSIHSLVETTSKEQVASYQAFLQHSKDSNQKIQENWQEIRNDFLAFQKDSREQNTTQVKQLEDRVLALSQQMQEYFTKLSDVLQQQTKQYSDDVTAQNNQLHDTTVQLNAQLQAVIQELRTYDTNFFKKIGDLQENLQKSVECNTVSALQNDKATKILQDMADRQLRSKDELIEAITQPLKNQLEAMSQQLSKDLTTISTGLMHINQPLIGASENMQKMLFNTSKTIREDVEAINKNFEEKMQYIVASLNKSGGGNTELQATCDNINASLQYLTKTIQAIAGVMGEKAGVDPEVVKRFMSNQPNYSSNSNRGVENKLESILRVLESQEQSKKTAVPRQGFLNIKNIPIIVIAVLLVISVCVQITMVYKISALEKSQIAVTELLAKGELNNTSDTASNNDAENR